MKAAAGLAAVLALALGGCTEGATQPEEGPVGPAASPAEMVLSGCSAWSAAATFLGPTAPGDRPAGWPPAEPERPNTEVTMAGLACERLSLGPFERGPFFLLWDGHSNADFPSRCREGGTSGRQPMVLHSFWVSDAEVAAFLADTASLPALAGAFAAADVPLPVPGAVRHDISWGPPSSEPSVLRIPEGPRVGSDSGYAFRLLWETGDGLGQLDLEVEGDGPGVGAPADAELQPPMLLHGSGREDTALSKWFTQAHATGTITLFGDHGCAVPRG